MHRRDGFEGGRALEMSWSARERWKTFRGERDDQTPSGGRSGEVVVVPRLSLQVKL